MMDTSGKPFGPSNLLITGGTVTNVNGNYYHIHDGGVKGGYERLLDEMAPNALHDSGHIVDPPKCHPNTRVAVIQKILDWATGLDVETKDKLIMWLSGAAGAGKSAIGRTFSEQCIAQGRLLASFFFGRTDPTRNHSRSLIATIAYQISTVHPSIRQSIVTFVERDPMIFSRSLLTQFRSLIMDPLSSFFRNQQTSPFVIVIDGLDECNDEAMQQDILATILGAATNSNLSLHFLICSRPENKIAASFSSTSMSAVLACLYLGDEYHADADISLYLRDHFDEIKANHIYKETLPDSWPNAATVDELVRKSSGQFIYASTVVKYVESSRHQPQQRLDAVLSLRPPFKDLPFTELDALYTHILSKADNIFLVLRILAFPLLYFDFPVAAIECLLDIELGDLKVSLCELASLVEVITNYNSFGKPVRSIIRVLHASLADFLLDPHRSQNLWIDSISQRSHHICRIMQKISDPDNQYSFRRRSLSSLYILDFPLEERLYTSELLQAVEQISILSLFKLVRHPSSFLAHLFLFLTSSKGMSLIYPIYRKHLVSLCDTVLAIFNEPHSDDGEMNLSFSLHYLMPWGPGYFPSWDILSCSTNANHFLKQITHLLIFSDLREVTAELASSIDVQHRRRIFARSATYCIQFLSTKGRFEKETFSMLGIADNRKRRKCPWVWRRTSPHRSLPKQWVLISENKFADWRPTATRYATALRKGGKSTNSLRRIYSMKEDFGRVRSKKSENPWQNWPLYVRLLKALSYFLPRAERYEPLIDMCQDPVFASMSCLFPKYVVRARSAMNDYLDRVEPKS